MSNQGHDRLKASFARTVAARGRHWAGHGLKLRATAVGAKQWVRGFEKAFGRRTSRPVRFAAALLLVTCAYLLAPYDDAQAQGFHSKVKPAIDLRQLESRMHELVNAERVRHGSPPLEHIEKLRLIARSHSKDMAKRAYFAHTSPEGHSATDRGNLVGYNCRKDNESRYTYRIAENIYQSWLYNSYKTLNGRIVSYNWFTPEGLARRVVKGWMRSRKHKENILKASYEGAGMGVAIAKDGKVYATQNFC
ncbi:MAG: CAP domain-containing protein [Albidovulum sp.]|nr:CAP domain-containing protein [Albidovulum sp.]